MLSAISRVELTHPDKLLVVHVLAQCAQKTGNVFRAQMYKTLAQKIVDTCGCIGLDGQEMTMIAFGLIQQADDCPNPRMIPIYRRLAGQLLREKHRLHVAAFEELAQRYLQDNQN